MNEISKFVFLSLLLQSHSSITDDESRSSLSFHSRNQKAVCAVYGLDKVISQSSFSI
jgi:hypothetical protein